MTFYCKNLECLAEMAMVEYFVADKADVEVVRSASRPDSRVVKQHSGWHGDESTIAALIDRVDIGYRHFPTPG